MQQVTVGAKYQIVIPKEVREKVKGLRPGAKVTVHKTDMGIITIKPLKQKWSDANYGILKKYWQGRDMASEVEKVRDEWEEEVKKLEKSHK